LSKIVGDSILPQRPGGAAAAHRAVNLGAGSRFEQQSGGIAHYAVEHGNGFHPGAKAGDIVQQGEEPLFPGGEDGFAFLIHPEVILAGEELG
jgi:hypothetical protein